jgi:hypothetical protein
MQVTYSSHMTQATNTLDLTFAVLQNEIRRHLLVVLGDETPPISLADLATAVATETEARTATQQQLQGQLHHVHLPKLNHCGITEYDPAEKVLRDWNGLDLEDEWRSPGQLKRVVNAVAD